MTVIMSNTDVVDCVKYLLDASVAPGLNLFMIMGIFLIYLFKSQIR